MAWLMRLKRVKLLINRKLRRGLSIFRRNLKWTLTILGRFGALVQMSAVLTWFARSLRVSNT